MGPTVEVCTGRPRLSVSSSMPKAFAVALNGSIPCRCDRSTKDVLQDFAKAVRSGTGPPPQDSPP